MATRARTATEVAGRIEVKTFWETIPTDRKKLLVELLVMEATGAGGWIDDDLWDDNPAEAQAQYDMILAGAEYLLRTIK